mgnify:CR=1 FL=1
MFPNGLPLKDRTNIVLSKSKNFAVKGATIVHSLEELLEELKKYPSEDISIKIAKLKDMKEQGIISEEEFYTKKAELIEQL